MGKHIQVYESSNNHWLVWFWNQFYNVMGWTLLVYESKDLKQIPRYPSAVWVGLITLIWLFSSYQTLPPILQTLHRAPDRVVSFHSNVMNTDSTCFSLRREIHFLTLFFFWLTFIFIFASTRIRHVIYIFSPYMWNMKV